MLRETTHRGPVINRGQVHGPHISGKGSNAAKTPLDRTGPARAPDNQRAKIKVKRGNTGVQTLKEDIAQKAKESVMPQGLAIEPLSRSVNMSGDNQGSIASAHQPGPFLNQNLLNPFDPFHLQGRILVSGTDTDAQGQFKSIMNLIKATTQLQ